MKKTLMIISLLIAIPSLIFAADRLIVEDGSGNNVFTVAEDGIVSVTGEDANNEFQMKVLGKANGNIHTALTTDSADSRLTVSATTVDDFAPRFQLVGPEDSGDFKGWVIFDFGSREKDLPDAVFQMRHNDTDGPVDMLRVFGRDAVTFPKSDVVVGIRTDNPNQPLQIGDSGAFCNGTQWIDRSSRESKENIAELDTREAFETLRQMTPVKFSYKEDAAHETNVGFIAEDVPELVATQGRKGMASLEVVAVLTKVVQEQQELIAELTERIENLEAR